MDLKSAFQYARDNHIVLLKEGKKIIGCAHTPDDSNGEFQVIDISLNEENVKDGVLWYDINFNGDCEYGGESIGELFEELPDFVKYINYQIYQVEGFSCLETWYILRELFPELPDLTSEYADKEFRALAITIITRLNALETV